MERCFTCLNCGKINDIKGHSYTNKYCNNSCQQQHRSRLLVKEWLEGDNLHLWRQVPGWVKRYLIEQHGHKCQVCLNKTHNGKPIPLDVTYKDGNSKNNNKSNLQLVCPNCRAQRN